MNKLLPIKVKNRFIPDQKCLEVTIDPKFLNQILVKSNILFTCLFNKMISSNHTLVINAIISKLVLSSRKYIYHELEVWLFYFLVTEPINFLQCFEVTFITGYFSYTPSCLRFFVHRISPYEWDNPHPCKSDPDELETQFTCSNALWFGIGSFLCQGSDILPK